MRSAQSRVAVLSSLDSAGQGVSRCVQALPVPGHVLKAVGGVAAGLAGAVLLRSLLTPRRAPAPKVLPPAPAAPLKQQPALGRYLLSETFVVLLLPLLRRYLMGQDAPASSAALPAAPASLSTGLDKLVSRLLRLGR